jgi:uroporphyrinogen-III synthase
MRLIVTRPEPDATRTGRALIRLGHEAILSPMLDIVNIPGVELPKLGFQAVLVTSANAVRALAGRADRTLASAPLFAVGDRTAVEAKRAGFALTRSAGGAVDDLVALIRAELSPGAGPLLYAAGEAQAGDLADRLAALGFAVETAVIYRAQPRARLAGVAEEALRQGTADGALLYSRRSALAVADALEAAGLLPLSKGLTIFCISAATARALPAGLGATIVIAERPDQLSLFALIEREAERQAPVPPTGKGA